MFSSSHYLVMLVFTAILSIYAVNRFNSFCRTNYPGKRINKLISIKDTALKKAAIKLIVLISIAFAPIFLMAAIDIILNLSKQ